MIKLIRETDNFKIQPKYNSLKSTKFINLFAKGFVFINTYLLLKY